MSISKDHEPTIRDIYYKLGTMEAKIDSVLVLQEDDRERLKQLENRTSKLERAEAQRNGMIAILVGVFSIISTIVVNFITKFLSIN